MTRFSDYTSDMPGTRLGDREIEQLLTRSTTSSEDLADLEAFVAALSRDLEPPRDPEFMATSLAAVARSAGRPRSRGLKRLATLATAGAMLLAMSGIAFAADAASPGHPLYGIDKALEAIGVGDGGVDERIAEFDVLFASGSEDDAFVFLASFIASADAQDATKAEDHLVLAAAGSDPNAAGAQEKAAAIREFIEANRGDGIGLDGREFGQAVSDIARSESEDVAEEAGADTPDQVGNENSNRPQQPGQEGNQAPGPPEHAGQGNQQPGPPEDAGQEGNQEPGPPEHAGQGNQETEPGPPADTGQNQGTEPGPPTDTGQSKKKEPGPPAETGPKEEKNPGPPTHAGPKEEPDSGTSNAGGGQNEKPQSDSQGGPPDHAGPKDNKSTGPPDHAGKK